MSTVICTRMLSGQTGYFCGPQSWAYLGSVPFSAWTIEHAHRYPDAAATEKDMRDLRGVGYRDCWLETVAA